jgi:hypothetical protein
MTTLAVDVSRNLELGTISEYPVIATDIIYKHAAVGLVAATGHARPLVAGDRFAGFAEKQADNNAGAAAAKNVRVITRGRVQLSVSGAVITDVGQPIYASDDDTFVFSPVGNSFVGFVERFVSSGVVVVAFNDRWRDPYGAYATREAVTGNKTLAATDNGKLFWVTADAVITLPAVATPALARIVNGGAYSTVLIQLSPQAADNVRGPDITVADDKDFINTKATAKRGDFAVLGFADANGYVVTEDVGTWVREA